MRLLIMLSLAGSLAASAAMADTCVATADGKKIYGAARTSFLTKCQKDAQATCDAQAAGKKIYGAAKTSYTTKCVKDAVGQ
jgi:hypothetical protein